MIQVIVRAIDILEFVSGHGEEPVQLYKIAEHAGLSNSTTATIVKTLLDKNYLEQLGRKKGYTLGINAYKLTNNPLYQQSLTTAAKEPMNLLTQELNEIAILAVIQNNKRVILHMAESKQVLQVNTVMVADIYDTSTGRLLMAYYPPKELDSLIKVIGLPSKTVWPGAETKRGLESALQKIREEAFVQVTSIYHTVGFAVPVYLNKKVIAALSIFVPASRYTASHKEKIANLIETAAAQITAGLEKANT